MEDLPNEGYVLRTLNFLKNKKLTKYDYAFKEYNPHNVGDNEQFIKEVRQTFFSFLKIFLKDIPKFIDKSRALDDTSTVFDKYFDIKGYLDSFSGEQAYPFAARLVHSTQFQSFCDDYFSGNETSNYRIFYGILDKDYAESDQD